MLCSKREKRPPVSTLARKKLGTFFRSFFRDDGVLTRCKITDRTYCFLPRRTHMRTHGRTLVCCCTSVYTHEGASTPAQTRISCGREQKVTRASAPSFLRPSEVRLITKRYVRKPARPRTLGIYKRRRTYLPTYLPAFIYVLRRI